MKLAVTKLWKCKKEVSIKLHGGCAFIFDFSNDDDRRRALVSGSFFISNQLFCVRPWSPLIEKTISYIKSVPIWVMIYGIPLHMWNNDGFGLIASFLGKPILADDFTINQTRLAYARICVEIDIEFSYPASIPLLIDGKYAMDLPVEYQWRPPKCEGCKVFRHTSENCSMKNKTLRTTKKDTHMESLVGAMKAIDVNGVLDKDLNDEIENTSNSKSLEMATLVAYKGPVVGTTGNFTAETPKEINGLIDANAVDTSVIAADIGSILGNNTGNKGNKVQEAKETKAEKLEEI